MHQPFDDVLDYESFSLRLSVADVPNLMSILKAISPAEIHQYRLNMWVLGLQIAGAHIMHQMGALKELSVCIYYFVFA